MPVCAAEQAVGLLKSVRRVHRPDRVDHVLGRQPVPPANQRARHKPAQPLCSAKRALPVRTLDNTGKPPQQATVEAHGSATLSVPVRKVGARSEGLHTL